MESRHPGNATTFVASSSEPCSSCGARPASVCGAIEKLDLDILAGAAVPIHIQAGQTFVYEGDPAESFYNLTSGTARLFKLLPDGRRQIIGFASTGHFLGLAVRDAYTFSAEAVDAVHLCRFSRQAMRHLIDDFPNLERRLLETASNELATAQEQMLLLGRKTARERLASFLIMQSGTGQPCLRQPAHIALPMTRSDIADYLGLTIETVSRTFTKLKADHLIELPSPHDVTIRNFEALESIAAGLN